MCKIALLENYSLYGSGIRSILAETKEFDVVAEVKEASELLTQLQTVKPDVIIMDIIHCESDGIKPLKKIGRSYSRVPVLLIVSDEYACNFEDYIAQGVKGFIFNDAGPEQLVQAVKTLKKGEDYFSPKVWQLLKDYLRTHKNQKEQNGKSTLLTKREISVLKLFCKGFSYKEIAADLDISPRTVETHKKNITTKLKIKSTAEMIQYAMQNNLN
jgi:DNA-binding NarL/FixJ family response regulator